MKRSEMIKKVRQAVNEARGVFDDPHISIEEADVVLSKLEQAGMNPPPIQGVYDTVPTVTPTGNLNYGFKREWEPE